MRRFAITENPPLRQRGSGIRFPTLSQEDVLHIGKYAQAMFGSGKKIEDVLPRYDVPVRIKGNLGQTGSGTLSSIWKMILPHAKSASKVAGKIGSNVAKSDMAKKLGTAAATAAGAAAAGAIINKISNNKNDTNKGEELINNTLRKGAKYKLDRSSTLKKGLDSASAIVDNDVKSLQKSVGNKMDMGTRKAAKMRMTTQGEVSEGARGLGQRANARMRGGMYVDNINPGQSIVAAYSGSGIRFNDSAPARLNIRFTKGLDHSVLQHGSVYGSGYFKDNIGETIKNSGKLLKKAANYGADVGSFAINRMVDKEYKHKGNGMCCNSHHGSGMYKVGTEKKNTKFLHENVQ